MREMQMGAIESRFADIIWENELISAAELARRSEELLQWKGTASYTVLKRLCETGIFRSDKGTVTSLISGEDFYSIQSERFAEETFHCPCRHFSLLLRQERIRPLRKSHSCGAWLQNTGRNDGGCLFEAP